MAGLKRLCVGLMSVCPVCPGPSVALWTPLVLAAVVAQTVPRSRGVRALARARRYAVTPTVYVTDRVYEGRYYSLVPRNVRTSYP